MTAPTIIPTAIADDLTATLCRLREARRRGDVDLEFVAEDHLNRRIERVGRLLQRLNERSTTP